MNDSGSLDTFDDHLFDLLADDELSDDRRRALLASLDRRPDGWRQCALAFLEAQSWRRELRGTLTGNDPSRPGTPADYPHRIPSRRVATVPQSLAALAMAFFVAFGLGWWAHSMNAGAAPSIVHHEANSASRNANPSRGQGVSPSAAKDSESVFPPEGAADHDVKLAGLLQWTVDENGQSRDVAVPVLEGPGIDVNWLLSQPPAIREPVRRELERRGHKIELHRRLITLNLEDGRSVVVPVDQLDVKLAGRIYQ